MSAAEYIRECPTCRAENPPDVMRCACGALLAGVDLVRKGARAKPAEAPAQPGPTEEIPERASDSGTSSFRPAPATGSAAGGVADASRSSAPAAESAVSASGLESPAVDPDGSGIARVVCPFADCGQTNPPDRMLCLYCNRPLKRTEAPGASGSESGLLRLPSALSEHYRIISVLPAVGAEAELLIVEARAGGPKRVAKIYRHGIVPKREVQERIARVDPQYQVQTLESGTSDGYAFEVMEYCERGSLRDLMAAGPLQGDSLAAVIRELAEAVASVHTAGLVHRDLKPENVLVREVQPLDLVLTDFSIASVMESTQRFTSVARTLDRKSVV